MRLYAAMQRLHAGGIGYDAATITKKQGGANAAGAIRRDGGCGIHWLTHR